MELIFFFYIFNSKTSKNVITTIFQSLTIFIYCISFLFQPIQFYQTKTIIGYKIDFIIMNLFGYLCFFLFKLKGIFNEDIGIKETNSIDLVIIIYLILIMIITLVLIIYYNNGNDLKIYPIVLNIIILLSFGAFLLFILESILEKYKSEDHINFNCFIYLGLCKYIMDLIKYIPQIIFNKSEKTTIGWNIYYIIFELISIILYYLSLISEIYNNSFDILNPPKNESKLIFYSELIIPFISLIYDIIFIVQQYLYYDSNEEYFAKYNKDKIIFLPKSTRDSEVFS